MQKLPNVDSKNAGKYEIEQFWGMPSVNTGP
jgi:hypothetical protein